MPTTVIDRTLVNYHDRSNARIRKIGRMVGPSSYTTGGDVTVTPALFGLGKVDVVLFEPFANAALTAIKWGRYDVATKAMQFFDNNTTETAAATDLSGFSARFEAIGYD